LVYALGGVDAQYARQALAAGADGVAVISAVLDPRSDIPSLLSALGIQR
jgi:thiamine monophosphate synthase